MRSRDLHTLAGLADALGPLANDLVLFGGCATGALLTDPAAEGLRPPTDVAAVIHVSSFGAYQQLCAQLRDLDCEPDATATGGWRHARFTLLVLPSDERILGIANRWHTPGIAAAVTVNAGDLRVRVMSPAHFLATRLETFRAGAIEDLRSSQELDDVLAVVDGRPEIVSDMRAAPQTLRRFVASELRELLARRPFVDAVPGYLPPDAANQARRPAIMERLRVIGELA